MTSIWINNFRKYGFLALLWWPPVSVATGYVSSDVDEWAWRVLVSYSIALSVHACFDGLSLGATKSQDGFTSLLIALLAHKVN